MGVHEGRGQLGKAMKDLLLRWTETRQDWDDVTTRNFEKDYLHTLEADLRNAVGAMDHMAVLLEQIRRECE